ncbi:MAG: hypothetical protein ACK4PR_01845, partial [Gammaproteobacteria bacterium]
DIHLMIMLHLKMDHKYQDSVSFYFPLKDKIILQLKVNFPKLMNRKSFCLNTVIDSALRLVGISNL